MAKLYSILSLYTLISLLTIAYSKSDIKYKGLQLRMIHIDSPESPMYESELTSIERTNRLISMSDVRARHLSEKTREGYFYEYNNNNNNNTKIINPLTIKVTTSKYYVEVKLGTFGDNLRRHRAFLSLDTGSDNTWTICEGCTSYLNLLEPKFSWGYSKTFVPVPCSQCSRSSNYCDQNRCVTVLTYNDNTKVTGFRANETLTLASELFQETSIENFQFVCGTRVENFTPGKNPLNRISGMLGMGKGQDSLISQLASRGLINSYKFSYCLQDSRSFGSSTLLKFGDDAQREDDMYFTTITTIPNLPFYYLNLIDICVNGERLNIPSDLFRVRANRYGGTVIDSGATLTYIVPNAYAKLLEYISTYMKANNPLMRWHEQDEEHRKHACWEPSFEYPNIRIPTLTFHFQDADLFVDTDQVFYYKSEPGIPKPGLYCLTVSPAVDAVNVIGVFHQVNKLIVYDIGNSRLYFKTKDCSSSTSA